MVKKKHKKHKERKDLHPKEIYKRCIWILTLKAKDFYYYNLIEFLDIILDKYTIYNQHVEEKWFDVVNGDFSFVIGDLSEMDAKALKGCLTSWGLPCSIEHNTVIVNPGKPLNSV